MPNPRRGEVGAVVDGRPVTLCLTLGALAELEAALGASDLVALAARFETGRLASADLLAVLHAGLCGGGQAMSREAVASARFEGGAAGAARAAAELLVATFGSEQPSAGAPPARPRPAREAQPPPAPPPSPGTP